MPTPTNTKRLFCRVVVAGEQKDHVVLLTTTSNDIPMSADGQFIKLQDVKMGKFHVFPVSRVVHVQFEDEREDH